MKYQGIIFDLDGVLCFTDRYHFFSLEGACGSFGDLFR